MFAQKHVRSLFFLAVLMALICHCTAAGSKVQTATVSFKKKSRWGISSSPDPMELVEDVPLKLQKGVIEKNEVRVMREGGKRVSGSYTIWWFTQKSAARNWVSQWQEWHEGQYTTQAPRLPNKKDFQLVRGSSSMLDAKDGVDFDKLLSQDHHDVCYLVLIRTKERGVLGNAQPLDPQVAEQEGEGSASQYYNKRSLGK